jgi:hypothetical protein
MSGVIATPVNGRVKVGQAEYVARALAPAANPLPPDPARAAEMFDLFVGWRPDPLPEQDPVHRIFGGHDAQREWEQKRRAVSAALGRLCWHLDEDNRTPERSKILLSFFREIRSEEALIGGLAFTDQPEILRSLRRLASSGASQQTYSFASALTTAIHYKRPIPQDMVDAAITASCQLKPSPAAYPSEPSPRHFPDGGLTRRHYAVRLCRPAPLRQLKSLISPPQNPIKYELCNAGLAEKRSRKPLRMQVLPGFESLFLRHIIENFRSILAFCSLGSGVCPPI